jgi:cytochrome c556
MLRTVLVTGTLVIGMVAALAQTDPIGERRNLMKAVGSATRTGSQMAKGEIPFDAAKAKEILQIYAQAADKTHSFFPETSKTGGGTTAAPKIWESQADFRARFDAWAKDIQAASASTNSLESFRASFTGLTRACSTCHQAYRVQT